MVPWLWRQMWSHRHTGHPVGPAAGARPSVGIRDRVAMEEPPVALRLQPQVRHWQVQANPQGLRLRSGLDSLFHEMSQPCRCPPCRIGASCDYLRLKKKCYNMSITPGHRQ